MAIGDTCFTYRDSIKCINVVAWSPDGRLLAAGSADGKVHVWEVETWKVVALFEMRTRHLANPQRFTIIEDIYALTWSMDEKSIRLNKGIVWDIHSGTLQILDVAPTNTSVYTREHTKFMGIGALIPNVHLENARPSYWYFHPEAYILAYCIDESPDKQLIAYGARDHAVWIWDVQQLKMALSYTHHTGSVMSVAWSPDGSKVASGSYDTNMQIYEVGASEKTSTCTGHENVVLDISWSPDGQQLASGSWDKTARVWDALTGECLYRYQGHTGPINSIAWSPDGRYLASGSWDHTVQVWEAI